MRTVTRSNSIDIPTRAKPLLAILLILTAIAAIYTAVDMTWGNYGIDYGIFMSAARATLEGQNPYDANTGFGFYNPPWALLPLIPLAMLPDKVGYTLLVIASFSSLYLFAKKIGLDMIGFAILATSPPVFQTMYNGNIDLLVLVGFVLPPEIGMLFLIVKPQMGIAFILYWGIIYLIDREWGKLARMAGIAAAVSLFSFIPWGFWPARMFAIETSAASWNVSMFPAGFAFGIAAFIYAIRNRDSLVAMAVSPFLAPYSTLQSFIVTLPAAKKNIYMLALSLGWYFIFIARSFGVFV